MWNTGPQNTKNQVCETWWWWSSCSVVSDSCNPRDCSLPGSSVQGISQGGILEWVAIFFSRGFSWPRDCTHVSCLAGGFFTTESPGKSSVFFFIMLIKTFPLIKIFTYNSLCTLESHMRSGSLSVHLLTCLQWLQFSVDKYLLSNEYKSLKVPLIQIHGLEMRSELPSVLQVVTIKPIQR